MLRVASLCSGYGGLEMALSLAGVEHELVWWAEIDASALKVMSAHTSAPNYGDLCEIRECPPVDLVTAGFPCQPVSAAGKRAGVDDERWIIDSVCRVARLAGARWLFLENVAGLLTANDGRALAAVCEALAKEGFRRWEWTTLRASDVGAPHQRERWFCLAESADPDSGRREALPPDPGVGRDVAVGDIAASDPGSGEPERRGTSGLLGGQTPAEPGERLQRQRPGDPARHSGADDSRAAGVAPNSRGSGWERAGSGPAGRGGSAVNGDGWDPPAADREDGHSLHGAHVDGCPCTGTWGQFGPAVDRWARVIGRCAPTPTVDGKLNPAAVEWMMGLPDRWVTDCGLSRTKALHVLGNGVVPQQAAAAFRILACWLVDPTAEVATAVQRPAGLLPTPQAVRRRSGGTPAAIGASSPKGDAGQTWWTRPTCWHREGKMTVVKASTS